MKKYDVTIYDAAENCDQTYLEERYDDLATARARYDELAAELAHDDGGWRDGIVLDLRETSDDVWYDSIDSTSK